MLFKQIGRIALIGTITASALFAPMADIQTADAAGKIDEKIFQWVQSSSRMGYYFNQQQICFKVVNNQIDIDTLIVPILKMYDPVQIKDTVDKRRWRMEPIGHFGDLAGRVEYAEIDLPNRTVFLKQSHYIDSTWSTIEPYNPPKQKLELDNMSERSLDKIFFSRVIDYAMRHQLELGTRTRGDLSDEIKAELSKRQQDYMESMDPELKAKRLEEERLKKEAEEAADKGKKKKKKENKK